MAELSCSGSESGVMVIASVLGALGPGTLPGLHGRPSDRLPRGCIRMDRSAAEDGGRAAILVRDGFVMEGAVSNVMAVQEGVLVTAPESPRILSGVTRTVVLQLARAEELVVEERFMPSTSLYKADEVFLTGTTLEVLGVVQIDGKLIGSGRPGPVTQSLAARWAILTG